MKHNTKIFSLSIFLFFFLVFSLTSQDNSPRVAVTAFNHPDSINRNDSQTLTSAFETALIKTNAFIVVKQSAVNVILQAQTFSVQDFTDKNYALKIGQLISANHIFLGTLSKIGARLILDVQLIDIENGQAVKANNVEAATIEGLLDKMENLAAAFAGNSKKQTVEYSNKVKVYVDLGDKFKAEQNYDKALEQYQKALKVEEFNTHIIRKSIQAGVEKLLTDSLYQGTSIRDELDIALRNDYQYFRFVPADTTDGIIEQILLLKTLDPAFEKDVPLLLTEATVYKVTGKVKEAIKVLEQALELAPANTDVLAELGLLTAFQSFKDKQTVDGIKFIKQAIEKTPENPLYHLYLARTLTRDDKKITAEAMREYRQAAMLAVADDFWTKRVMRFAAQSLQRIFFDLGAYPDGILTKDLKMDFEERLDHLLYLIENKISFYSRTDIQNPDFYLANLYFATNRLTEAAETMRKLIKDREAYWKKNLPWLLLFKQILEKSKADGPLLKEVGAAIENLKK